MKKIFCAVLMMALAATSLPVFAISESKQIAISDNCDSIKTSLTNLQHADSRARVYLGRLYETILNKFIVPLNMRLVENSISNSEMVETQGNYKTARQKFIDDYIRYQQSLEELVAINCKDEPEKFYEKLQSTREKQNVVAQDTAKMRKLMTAHVDLVKKLLEEIK